ncbi:HEPN domain-containing protein [Pseudomonas benzenivorans]|nr:HEPN domain-containing protein [Pseudomonas benzenivorans]SDI25340.1 HEPN domain-containing protein [Pseudomonas benzenivorans]
MSKIPPGPKTVLLNGISVGEVVSTGDTERDSEAVRQFLKSKGLHKETSQFQAVFNQALAFANTSAYLYERDLRCSPRNGVSLVPFVVNAAFSIELYLKALSQKHGVALRGHELIKLYEALPSKAHIEIQTVTPRCADNRTLGEPPELLAYLKDLNNAFIEWRYSYELERTGAVHIEPTIFVMEVLHEACRLPAA